MGDEALLGFAVASIFFILLVIRLISASSLAEDMYTMIVTYRML